MAVCAIKLCKNYWKKTLDEKKITFHKFPTDPVLAKRWTEIIRKSRNDFFWKSKTRTFVCSAHFSKQDICLTKGGLHKIRKGAIPTKDLYISSTESENDETEDLIITDVSANNAMLGNLDHKPSTSYQMSPKLETLGSFCHNKLLEAKETTEENKQDVDLYISITKVENDETEDLITTDVSTNNAMLRSLDHKPSTSYQMSPKFETLGSFCHSKLLEVNVTTEENKQDVEIQSSDMDYLFDTPIISKLRNELRRKTVLQLKHARKIKLLQQRNQRLKTKNMSLRLIIQKLKDQCYINNGIHKLLSKNKKKIF